MDVILFGAGSPVIVDIEESCRRAGWRVAAIVRNVAAPDQAGAASLLIDLAAASPLRLPVLVPLFNPDNRRHAAAEATAHGATEFPALVDPTAILPARLDLGAGVYVNAGCTIGAASRLGRFAFVNRGAVLGHHLDLGDFASIGPGVVVAGQVTIGEGAQLGAGAVVAPGVRIGAGARVAPGTVVRRDVAAGETVAGNPARTVRPQ